MPESSSSHSSIRAYCRAFIFLAKATSSEFVSKPPNAFDPGDDLFGAQPRPFLGTKLLQAGDDLGGSHGCAPSMGSGSFRANFESPQLLDQPEQFHHSGILA